jgi:hypothetical protein
LPFPVLDDDCGRFAQFGFYTIAGVSHYHAHARATSVSRTADSPPHQSLSLKRQKLLCLPESRGGARRKNYRAYAAHSSIGARAGVRGAVRS